MTPLSDLIARLEAAKEGSRELDIAILTEVMGFRRVAENLFYGPKPEEWSYTLDGDGQPTLPSPTRSLDAALTLVPEDLSWAVKSPGFQSLRKTFLVELESGDYQWCGEGWNPALALCIASLKAREAAR